MCCNHSRQSAIPVSEEGDHEHHDKQGEEDADDDAGVTDGLLLAAVVHPFGLGLVGGVIVVVISLKRGWVVCVVVVVTC